MKAFASLVLALLAHSATADPFFTGNPWTVIPPGCITRPDLQAELYGNHSFVVFDGQARLRGADSPDSFENYLAGPEPAMVRIRRVACAEPGRSALFVEHRIAPTGFGYSRRYLLPDYLWDPAAGGTLGWLSMEPERQSGLPNHRTGTNIQAAFGDFSDGWLGGDFGAVLQWTYVLDSPGPLPRYPTLSPISAEHYNQELLLYSDQHASMDPGRFVPWVVPPTGNLDFGVVPMPLNGRHSGTWVVAGAQDQGLTLSFTNRLPTQATLAAEPERSPVFVFLAWYTFDAEGQLLWLTGSGEFEQGADSVELALVLVTNGEFLGTRRANRAPAGSATLTAKSCADLVLDYDLSAIGLGAGPVQLERLHELEIAGYNCRDHEARRTAAFGVAATQVH